MTWYLYHQQAKDIIAQRQREADLARLAYLARLAEDGRPIPPSRPAFAGLRHAAARTIHAAGRSATRLAEALDVDGDTTSGTARAR